MNNTLSSVCMFVSGLCIVYYHEVVRIVQYGFQPKAEATPFLYVGCLRTFFKPKDKVVFQLQETKYTYTNKNKMSK